MIYLLIGLLIILFTIWDYRREEAEFVFWLELSSWDVNRSNHPILFWITIISQLLVGILCAAWGVISYFYF